MTTRRATFADTQSLSLVIPSSSAEEQAEYPTTPVSASAFASTHPCPVDQLRKSGALFRSLDFALGADDFAASVFALLGDAAQEPASSDGAAAIAVRFVHPGTGRRLAWTLFEAQGHGAHPLSVYDLLRKTRRTLHAASATQQRVIDACGDETWFYAFTKDDAGDASTQLMWTLELTSGSAQT
ncbi:hypothetical protein MKEN_00397700 [Mycena kentingensis (nom. inval.)]|nr:hypothetical protein MKEN_00397700 [Mycena kentingensis (nom. inval.)]